MTEFLRLLAFYYACDQAAAIRPLTADEVATCMRHYEAVKVHFAPDGYLPGPGTPDRAQQNRAAYAGFKAWEAQNRELVQSLQNRTGG